MHQGVALIGLERLVARLDRRRDAVIAGQMLAVERLDAASGH